jgi:hypothetical protein
MVYRCGLQVNYSTSFYWPPRFIHQDTTSQEIYCEIKRLTLSISIAEHKIEVEKSRDKHTSGT